MVSADGLEPSSNALKGRRLRVLPHGTKDLQLPNNCPIRGETPQSAVNLQLIYILAPGLLLRTESATGKPRAMLKHPGPLAKSDRRYSEQNVFIATAPIYRSKSARC